MTEKHISTYISEFTGSECKQLESLPVSGSDRRYFRFHYQNNSYIIAYNDNIQENRSYFTLSKAIEKIDIPVPEIHHISSDEKAYVLKDLGDTSLLNYLQQNRVDGNISEQVISIYKQVIRDLLKMQFLVPKHFDFKHAFLYKKFDSQVILRDLNYFKQHFVDLFNVPYDEDQLNNDFQYFVGEIAKMDNTYFLYRDFQSRNIMLVGETPYYIDFQGGMEGPLHYDLVSLIYQAKAQLSDELRQYLIDYYVQKHNCFKKVSYDKFTMELERFVVLRMLQTLGAYGRRGVKENKPHFMESLQLGIQNISNYWNLVSWREKVPELNRIIQYIQQNQILSNAYSFNK